MKIVVVFFFFFFGDAIFLFYFSELEVSFLGGKFVQKNQNCLLKVKFRT